MYTRRRRSDAIILISQERVFACREAGYDYFSVTTYHDIPTCVTLNGTRIIHYDAARRVAVNDYIIIL